MDAKWKTGKPPANASNACAMPGNDPGTYTGWCYCKDSHDDSWDYCTNPTDFPTQINLQVAGADAVVASFVTFGQSSGSRMNMNAGDPDGSSDAPIVEWGTDRQLSAGGDPLRRVRTSRASFLQGAQT